MNMVKVEGLLFVNVDVVDVIYVEKPKKKNEKRKKIKMGEGDIHVFM